MLRVFYHFLKVRPSTEYGTISDYANDFIDTFSRSNPAAHRMHSGVCAERNRDVYADHNRARA